MLLDKSIPFPYIANKIKYDLLRVLIISAVFHTLKIFFSEHLPVIPFTLPAVLGTSISLLLAFKVNQSYDRWWEARKVWGAIVNDSRILVLQLKGFIHVQDEKSQLILRRISFRQIGWCYSLGQSLRGHDAMKGLAEFIPDKEYNESFSHRNKPLYLSKQHMEDLKKLHSQKYINDYQQIQVEQSISRLVDSMGKAERINTTVFPSTYRRYIHFFIYLFLIVLSLALVETIGLYEIPLLTFIASTFFLVEKTAYHMQDPFKDRPTDTSMTAIARTVEINIKQLLKEKNVPQPLAPKDFYLM